MNTEASSGSTRSGPAGRTRRWSTLALAAVLLLVLAALGAVSMVHAIDMAPIHVTINGEPIDGHLGLAQMPPAHKVVMVCLLAVALLATLVIVPVAIVVVVLAVLLIALLMVGLPMVVVALVLAVALSPLILLLWLLWRALRPSTTIRA